VKDPSYFSEKGYGSFDRFHRLQNDNLRQTKLLLLVQTFRILARTSVGDIVNEGGNQTGIIDKYPEKRIPEENVKKFSG
jgi:hypothetical protein